VRVAAVSGVIVIVTLIGLIAAESFGGVTRQIGAR
jgi:putative spermidine/putrescine transport system permease protein